MNLSFKPTCAGVSLWWAVAWRGLIVSLLLIVPIVVIFIGLQLAMGLGLVAAYTVSPYLGLAATIAFIILNVFVQWFFIPVAVYAGVFRWMFSRGRFGRYAISGAYRGQPVNSMGKAIKYSAWFFLENFKYVWPLFFGGMLLGFMADDHGNFAPPEQTALLLSIPLSVYLYMLVVSDLIKRRKFSKLELVVAPLASKPEVPKALEKVAAKPVAKAATKAVAKPAAKAVAAAPVAKKTVKTAAKPAPKLVVKAKPKPAVKAAAKAKPKPKKK